MRDERISTTQAGYRLLRSIHPRNQQRLPLSHLQGTKLGLQKPSELKLNGTAAT